MLSWKKGKDARSIVTHPKTQPLVIPKIEEWRQQFLNCDGKNLKNQLGFESVCLWELRQQQLVGTQVGYIILTTGFFSTLLKL